MISDGLLQEAATLASPVPIDDDVLAIINRQLIDTGYFTLTVQASALHDPEFVQLLRKYHANHTVTSNVADEIGVLPDGCLAFVTGLKVTKDRPGSTAVSDSHGPDILYSESLEIYKTIAQWERVDGLSHEDAVARFAEQNPSIASDTIEQSYELGHREDATVERPGDSRSRVAYRRVKALIAAGHSKSDAIATAARLVRLKPGTVSGQLQRLPLCRSGASRRFTHAEREAADQLRQRTTRSERQKPAWALDTGGPPRAKRRGGQHPRQLRWSITKLRSGQSSRRRCLLAMTQGLPRCRYSVPGSNKSR